jgi:outer membrane immunogenic protein
MKQLYIITCAALFSLASSAYAQGPEDWSGFYLGAQGGYGWGDRDGCFSFFDTDCDFDTFSYDQDGGLGGVKAGYNYMLNNNFLLGVEIDGFLASISGDGDFGGFPGEGEYNTLATFGGRLGYTMNQFLIYGTGGYAVASFDFEGSSGCSFDQDRNGYFVGGGAEFKFTERASVGIEYNYVDLGEDDQTCTTFGFLPTFTQSDATLNIITFGFNYNFGGM